MPAYCMVVVNRRGPAGRFSSSSLTSFGKLCPCSHFSTSIRQSVSSTDEILMSGRRAIADTQAIDTDSRFAVKKGRSPG